MKAGLYQVYILLLRQNGIASTKRLHVIVLLGMLLLPNYCVGVVYTLSSTRESTLCMHGKNNLQLRRNHFYYSQEQVQMAITKRNRCDFATKGIVIHTTEFDPFFWTNELLPKLVNFFDKFCPSHCTPVRNESTQFKQ